MSADAVGDPNFELITARLVLRSFSTQDVTSILTGRHLPDWAPDFPQEGDRDIAGMLSRSGVPTGDARVFGPRLVIEQATGQAAGGVGFFGPPQDGRVEIGYGIVASRRRRGYATEAVQAMLSYAFGQPGVAEVVATADLDNVASHRVLQKSGLTYQSEDEALVTYLVRS